MDDELLDLVDKNDIVIGTINRRDSRRLLSEDLGFIRVVDMFILNSKGQVYTPVRTAHKTIAPSGLDYSVGGHVESGADYLPTIIRETKEELNLDIQEKELEQIAKTISEEIRLIRRVFLLRGNLTPQLNPADFVSAEWLYPDEIIRKIDHGHPAKSNLRETVQLLQDYLNKNI